MNTKECEHCAGTGECYSMEFGCGIECCYCYGTGYIDEDEEE